MAKGEVMNNAVYNQSKIVGFRCWECGKIVQSMWGNTCNSCREKERRHQEILKALTKKNKGEVRRNYQKKYFFYDYIAEHKRGSEK